MALKGDLAVAREAEATRPGRGAREVLDMHKMPHRYVPPGAVQSYQHTTASSFENPAWCFVGGVRRGDCWDAITDGLVEPRDYFAHHGALDARSWQKMLDRYLLSTYR